MGPRPHDDPSDTPLAPDSTGAPARSRRTTVFGVLGGIASGKSEVARLLAGPRGRVLSADDFAQEALDLPRIQRELERAFGPDAIGPDGRTDRAALARRVFDDDRARRRLEGWIHPLVREKILAGLAEARSRGTERVVLDVPLLLENDAQHGLAGLCDYLVFVDASDEVRESRATTRRQWRPGEVGRREKAQLVLQDKRRRAHYRVPNDGTPDELAAAVRDVLEDVGLE